MDKISDLKLDHQNEVVEPFLCGLRDHPIPTPGIDTILSVVPNGVDAGQVGVCMCMIRWVGVYSSVGGCLHACFCVPLVQGYMW